MASWRVNSDLRNPQSLGVGCSDINDMPIGASDELDILLMRQDRLNKQHQQYRGDVYTSAVSAIRHRIVLFSA